MISALINWLKTKRRLYPPDLVSKYSSCIENRERDKLVRWPNIIKKPDHRRKIKECILRIITIPLLHFINNERLDRYKAETILDVMSKMVVEYNYAPYQLCWQMAIIIIYYNIPPKRAYVELIDYVFTSCGFPNNLLWRDVRSARHLIKKYKDNDLEIFNFAYMFVYSIFNENWKISNLILKNQNKQIFDTSNEYKSFKFPIKTHFIRYNKTVLLEFNFHYGYDDIVILSLAISLYTRFRPKN